MKTSTILFAAALAATGASAQQAEQSQQACGACHGAQGEGNAQMKAPRIAGLGEGYIVRQLDAYASGARQNPLMSPVAQQLPPEQRRAMAQAYAAIEPAKSSKAAPASSSAAAKLASVGDARREVQACANCHGPDGVGEPPMIPSLAGQQPAYLADTLRAWKSGARKTDPSGQMNLIASKLQDADIDALSKYFAALPPPSPKLLLSQGPARAPEQPSTASGGTNPVQGTGVSQGASTTQAPQGPGAGTSSSNDPGKR